VLKNLEYVILKRGELQTYWFTVTKFICCTSHTWRLNNDIIDDSYKNNITRHEYSFLVQHAKKVVSDSLGLVDFAIRLVNSVFNLPDG